MTNDPSESSSGGCRPPVGIWSNPMVCSVSQSLLHMELYKLHSELGKEGSAKNGVLPNNKQYSVTPRAQTSIDFVIGGRGRMEATVEELPTAWREEEPEERVGSWVCSKTTSGARKEGVPALLVRSESSSRMGSCGSLSPSLPAAASRCAYEKWETPKSPIFTCRRSSVHKRLAGLMSRWMMPW